MAKLTDSQVQNICIRYLTGESTVQLGKAFNVHSSTIQYALQKKNIKRRSIDDGSATGLPAARIAKSCGGRGGW